MAKDIASLSSADKSALVAALAGAGMQALAVPYLGQVATRGFVPKQANTSYKQMNAQRLHIARDNITSLQVAFANWFANGTGGEQAPGGTAVFTASIQYPIGSAWQQFTWGGNASSPVVADGATSPLSDALTLTTVIPAGQGFLIRCYGVFSAAIVLDAAATAHGTSYDLLDYMASGNTDKTMNGATFNPGVSNVYGACLVVGQTRRPSCLLLGDSRVYGQADAVDGAGDLGEFGKSIGPHFAYANVGCAGELVNNFVGNFTRRQALGAYFSHVLCNWGINDLSNARTANQIIADIGTVANTVFPTKKVLWSTIYPAPTTTDGFLTLANQTANANDAVRVSVNNALRRGVVPGLAGVFDNASAVEAPTDSGKYIVTATGQALSAQGDGYHMNFTGYQVLKLARTVQPSMISR